MFGALIGIIYNFKNETNETKLADKINLLFYIEVIMYSNLINDKGKIKELLSEYKYDYRETFLYLPCVISPISWHARSLDEVDEFTHKINNYLNLSEEVYYHSAMVAKAIYLARIGKDKDYIYNYINRNYDLNNCISYITISFEIFKESNSFKECLKEALKIKKYAYLIAPIVCSIAEAYYKDIPIKTKKELFYYLPKANKVYIPSKLLYEFYEYQIYDLTQAEEINSKTKFLCLINNNNELVTRYYWYHSTSYKVLLEQFLYESIYTYLGIEDDDLYKASLEELEYEEAIQVLKSIYFPDDVIQSILSKFEEFFKNDMKFNCLSLEKLMNEFNIYFKDQMEIKLFKNLKEAKFFLDKNCKCNNDLRDFSTIYTVDKNINLYE